MINPPPFPPLTIVKWLRLKTVSSADLVKELREWADYMDQPEGSTVRMEEK